MVYWLQSNNVARVSAPVLQGEIYKPIRALPDVTYSTKTLNQVFHPGYYIAIETDAD
tara:strand:+ start:1577 stop:1747 length:171 start_codon:yes stop_codon:yes gene_type:complete